MDSPGFNKIKPNIDFENNKGQKFLNRSPLDRLQTKTLQDFNHWIKTKTAKRYSNNVAAEDKINCFNTVCSDLGRTDEIPRRTTRQRMILNSWHLGKLLPFSTLHSSYVKPNNLNVSIKYTILNI